MSRYLKITKDEKYRITSKRTKLQLGEIKYYQDWNKYIFEPELNTVFDAECLKDIINWLNDITEGRM